MKVYKTSSCYQQSKEEPKLASNESTELRELNILKTESTTTDPKGDELNQTSSSLDGEVRL